MLDARGRRSEDFVRGSGGEEVKSSRSVSERLMATIEGRCLSAAALLAGGLKAKVEVGAKLDRVRIAGGRKVPRL